MKETEQNNSEICICMLMIRDGNFLNDMEGRWYFILICNSNAFLAIYIN
jgi:hypothetical protein